MNTQNFKNESGKFPLTTDSLDFIQDQIKLVYGLTDLAGKFIIIREPSGIFPGLVIVNGELLPLTGSKSSKTTKILVSQVDKTITVGDGTEFDGIVRTERMAMYPNETRDIGGVKGDINMGSRIGSAPGTGEYALSKFTVLKNMQTLMSELDEAKKHLMPKGAITMWSGTVDTIPTGWALCDGQNGTPNLQGRFVIGYGIYTAESPSVTYPTGSTGGKRTVKLEVQHMPAHNHNITRSTTDVDVYTEYEGVRPKFGGNDGGNATIPDSSCFEIADGNGANGNDLTAAQLFPTTHRHKLTLYSSGGGQAHDNMPPYYALAYIMKVI